MVGVSMMKKFLCFLFCFFSGILCLHATDEMNYKLTIKDGKLQEQIVFQFENYHPITNGDDPKRVVIQQPIYTDKYQQTKYQKNVQKNGNNYTITLNHTYNEYQFKNSYLLSFCFDNANFSYNEEYYRFSLSSSNNCFIADKMKVQLISDRKMVNTNGKKINDQTYEWEIGSTANISFQLSKNLKYTTPTVIETPSEKEEPKEKEKSSLGIWILSISGILLGIIVLIFIIKYQKNNRKNNTI